MFVGGLNVAVVARALARREPKTNRQHLADEQKKILVFTMFETNIIKVFIS